MPFSHLGSFANSQLWQYISLVRRAIEYIYALRPLILAEKQQCFSALAFSPFYVSYG